MCQGHGRLEIRQCWTISDPAYLNYIRNRHKWAQLNTIVMVTSERRRGEEVTKETRYFISSLPKDAEKMLTAVRTHWRIENSRWCVKLCVISKEQKIHLASEPVEI